MKPSAIRIERLLEKIEARLAPPPRRGLSIITHEGVDDDEAAVAKKKEEALAEHVAAHPEDAGRTVEDFDWWVWEIVHPKFIIGADGRVRWPTDGGEDTDKDTAAAARDEITKGKIEDELVATAAPVTEEAPRAEFAPAPAEPEGLGVKVAELMAPDPPCLIRSKPWRPVHQRPKYRRPADQSRQQL
jgi:hypothetical protein